MTFYNSGNLLQIKKMASIFRDSSWSSITTSTLKGSILFIWMSKKMLPKLPVIENAVSRILTHSKQFSMSLPSWGRATVQLLVKYQIYFKIALMTSATTYSFGFTTRAQEWWWGWEKWLSQTCVRTEVDQCNKEAWIQHHLYRKIKVRFFLKSYQYS